jgi:hypothetical protein
MIAGHKQQLENAREDTYLEPSEGNYPIDTLISELKTPKV